MDLAQLIEELSRPRAYPFPVDEVEVHQTHISAVFLAGSFAYKLKKPVQLGILNFSTLEKRKHYCEEEVHLNRRLAPEVYLGVVPVTIQQEKLQVEGEGEIVEWAVKMKRLPQEATLERRLLRKEVKPEAIQSLAGKIAGFHKSAASNQHIAEFGRFEIVARNALENFEQSRNQIGTTISEVVWQRLKELTERELEKNRPLIEKRAVQGIPRDTHGDLHLDHVYLFPEEYPPNDLVIVDCIEFNERFRFADPVADMAFLVMDLIFHHRQDLAAIFSQAYFQASEDQEGKKLLPFYSSYRAAIRGKVKGMELTEKEIPKEEQQAALKKSRAHWLLALGELEIPLRKPCLLLLGGLPGSGKSTLGKAIAQKAGFSIIRTDEVRKQLVGIKPEEAASPEHYSQEWTERTYGECLHRAEKVLFEGKRVLLDGNFWAENKRQMFLEMAKTWGVPSVFFLCQADPKVVQQRLENRQGDASDATWDVHVQVAEKWQEIGEKTSPYLREISTNGDRDSAIRQALNELQKLNLYAK